MHKVVPLHSHPGFDVDVSTGTVRLRPPQPLRPVSQAVGMRQYSAARNTRNTLGFGGTTTSA
ncbi:MAG: hypothetical protein KDF67_15180, partial [Ottowia sp.]|nr:hypothetical protein [Ottowia sp.]